MKDLFTEIVDYAEQIKAKVEKASELVEEEAERADRERQDFETNLREQIEAEERHWEARFELVVEKVDDFERGLITLDELKDATR